MLGNHALPMVLLGTILVPIRNSSGLECVAKVLLDSGSCASFVTEKFFKKLQLPRKTAMLFCTLLVTARRKR